MDYRKPVIFEKLNRKLLCVVFKHLSTEDLSLLNKTCRRLNNSVQYYVKSLQVLCFDYNEDRKEFVTSKEFNHAILRYCSPAKFFSPHLPFKCVENLYLSFNNYRKQEIDLHNLMSLKYLKIRGKLPAKCRYCKQICKRFKSF